MQIRDCGIGKIELIESKLEECICCKIRAWRFNMREYDLMHVSESISKWEQRMENEGMSLYGGKTMSIWC